MRHHAPWTAICLVTLLRAAPAVAEPLSLSGTWAQRIINSQVVHGPLGSDTVTVTTLVRQTLLQEGRTVRISNEVCAVTVTPYKRERVIFPPRAVAAFHIPPTTVTLSEDAVGAKFIPPQGILLIGWRSQDPATDPLPGSPEDARVVDEDGDGKPGVTIRIKGLISGEAYIVSRFYVDLTGVVKSSDRIEGLSTTAQAQHVLDASTRLLRGDVSATPNDTGTSSFQMVRLAPGRDDCGHIIRTQDTLFR